MKKYLGITFIFCAYICFAQEESTEKKCYSLIGSWQGEYGNSGYIIHHNKTKSECEELRSKYKPHKNGVYGYITYTFEKSCECERKLKSKPATPISSNNINTKSSTSSSTSPKPRPGLNTNDAAIMSSMFDALYKSSQSAIDEKNRKNEQNANKFKGGRPSSEQTYNLETLHINSSSDIKPLANQNNQNEVIEFDSDDDGIIDTRRTTKPGETPVYEKIDNERPSAIEYYNNDELISYASTLAEVAESLGNDTYTNGLGNAAEKLTDLSDIQKLKYFYDHPDNNKAAIDATNIFGSKIATALSKMSGMFYDRFTAPIPNLQKDVMNSSLEQACSLLTEGTYDEKEVWRALGNYFGNGTGMGNVGDRAIDFTKEGNKSWGQLKSEYGFFEGTKKAVVYYLLNDLKTNSIQ